jgi:hypothetical protein
MYIYNYTMRYFVPSVPLPSNPHFDLISKKQSYFFLFDFYKRYYNNNKKMVFIQQGEIVSPIILITVYRNIAFLHEWEEMRSILFSCFISVAMVCKKKKKSQQIIILFLYYTECFDSQSVIKVSTVVVLLSLDWIVVSSTVNTSLDIPKRHFSSSS